MVNMGELFAYPRIGHVRMDLVPVSSTEKVFLLSPGDLLFARQSLVRDGAGQCSIFLGNSSPTVFESHLIRCRLAPERAVPDFYFYFFRSPQGRVAIDAIIEQGAGAAGIRGSDLVRLLVPVPSLSEQRWVSDLLRTLDDRIDLLRETNVTLESIAQALFKSWFIDFDPVRAKAEGREPEGMDAATAALFPAEFERSALGMIPAGWRVERLGSLVELAYGKALKATDRRPGAVPVYGSGGITGYHDEALVQRGSVIVGRKGTVGALYWEDMPFFPIDTTFYVKPKTAPLTFCFYAMQRLGLAQMNTDAAVPGLNRENAYRLEMVLPVPEVLQAFDGLAGSLRQTMRANALRAGTLVEMRDALLPRLISGRLRLPDSGVKLEEAIA